MEFKRTFVWDAMIAHALVAAGKPIPEVLARLVNILRERPLFRRHRSLRGRSLARTLSHSIQVLAHLMAEAKDGRMPSRRQVEARLRRFIEHKAVDDLLAGVDPVSDDTGCGLAQQVPQLRDGAYELKIKCTAKERICRLPEMLGKQHRADLRKVLAALRALREDCKLPKGLRSALDAVEEVEADPAKARGQRCMALGDVIISLESPRSHEILTLNLAHLAPIASAIGRRAKDPEVVVGARKG